MNYSVLRWKAAQFTGLLTVVVLADQTLHLLFDAGWLAHEADATAILVPLIGEIYAVLLAFMIFVIWTQFTEVENCVLREANS